MTPSVLAAPARNSVVEPDMLSFPYTHPLDSHITQQDLQHWAVILPPHAILATPKSPIVRFHYLRTTDGGLPHMSIGSTLSISLRGYILVHFRYGLRFCREELMTPNYLDATPPYYQGEWIIP